MFTMKDVIETADLLLLDGKTKMFYANDIETRFVVGVPVYVLGRNYYETLVPANQPVDTSDSPTLKVTGWDRNGFGDEVEIRFEAHVLNPVGHILRERQG